MEIRKNGKRIRKKTEMQKSEKRDVINRQSVLREKEREREDSKKSKENGNSR